MSVVDVTTSSNSSTPAVFELTTGGMWPITIDFSAVISTASGDAPTAASATLRDLQTGQTVSSALIGTPTLSTSPWSVRQVLSGATLQAGHSYDLLVTVDVIPNQKRVDARLRVEVV